MGQAQGVEFAKSGVGAKSNIYLETCLKGSSLWVCSILGV